MVILQISETPESAVDDVWKFFSIDDLNALVDRRWNSDARAGCERIE